MDKELRDKEIIESEEITESPIQKEQERKRLQEKLDFQQKEKKDNSQSGKSSVKIGIVERPRGSSSKGRTIWEKEIIPSDGSGANGSKIVEVIDDEVEIAKDLGQGCQGKTKNNLLSKEEVEKLEREKKRKSEEKKETHELCRKNSKQPKTTLYNVGLLGFLGLLGIGSVVLIGKRN
jgi:hypothetical protein